MQISNSESGENVRYKLNHGLNGSAMRGFYPSDKWHYALFNVKKNSPRKIVFIGDSIFNAVRGNMQDVLSENYYCNGMGFIKLDEDGTYNSKQYTLVISNSTYVEDSENNDEWGISGEVCKLSTTGTISFTQTDQSGDDNKWIFTAFNIYYLKRSGGGVFRYRVDEGDWTQVDTSNSSSELGIITVEDINLDYPQNHLIEIESVSGENWIYGLRTYMQMSSGITPDFIHQGGSSAQEWATKSHYLDYIEDVSPDQVHIFLGYNDYGSSRTAAQFIADIDTIVTAIQTKINSYCDIVLYGHYDIGTDDDINSPDVDYNTGIDEYDQELSDYAIENGVSYYDVSLAFPSRSIGGDMDIWNDAIHLNTNGGIYMTRQINEFISIPSINEKLVNQGTNYAEADLRIEFNKKIGFYRRTSEGVISDLNLLIYTLNANRLYFQAGTNGLYIFREFFDVPVPISPPTVADASAANNTLFIGSDHSNKLCFKDSGGTVHELY
jgi:lysophospholipase L1-like esterase